MTLLKDFVFDDNNLSNDECPPGRHAFPIKVT